jgi:DNA-binding transcriptional MerR regulator
MAIPPLPEKKYFKIGEVADLVGVEPHVLRYWETQFSQLRPHKARSGHRLYRRREVETLLVIRELLHVQRFTIAGARQALRQPGGASSLLPRFFSADGAAPSGPPTLVPRHDNDNDDDSDALADDDAAAGTEIGDAAVAEIEVEGLEGDELQAAMEQQGLEQQNAGSLVEVDVEGVEVPPAPSVKSPVKSVRAVKHPLGGLAAVAAALSPQKRVLLEDALGDARAVLAILDREDLRALPFTR